MGIIDHKCLFCGVEFRDYASSKRVFCSRSCFDKSKIGIIPKHTPIKREERRCLQCGNSFQCKPSDRKKFCTFECSVVSQTNDKLNKREKKNCGICGAIFYVPKCRVLSAQFCSNKCRSVAVGLKIRKPAIYKNCLFCEREFSVRSCIAKIRNYCSVKCSSRALTKRGKDSPHWKGGIDYRKAIRESGKYRKWRNNIFKRDEYTCQKCHIKGGRLEVNHIVLFSEILRKNNIRSLESALNCYELWNEGNGITLCKECHRKIRGKEKEKSAEMYILAKTSEFRSYQGITCKELWEDSDRIVRQREKEEYENYMKKYAIIKI